MEVRHPGGGASEAKLFHSQAGRCAGDGTVNGSGDEVVGPCGGASLTAEKAAWSPVRSM